MGVIKLLKEIRSGKGDKFIMCDSCEMFSDCSKLDLGNLEVDTEEFVCAKCVQLKGLLDRESGRKDILVSVGTDCQGLSEGEVVKEGEGKGKASLNLVRDFETKGVILGDSMVRFVGNEVGRVKPNVVRCCLSGARVKDVKQAVQRGAVSKNDKVTIWAGTNNVGVSNNNDFRRDFTEMLEGVKSKTRDVRVLGLLPRYGVKCGFSNQRARVMNRILKEVCVEQGVGFVDLWGVCKRHWVSWDGIHLSGEGNREVATLILNGLDSKN
jgi:lysophospholipase L1-like esterase